MDLINFVWAIQKLEQSKKLPCSTLYFLLLISRQEILQIKQQITVHQDTQDVHYGYKKVMSYRGIIQIPPLVCSHPICMRKDIETLSMLLTYNSKHVRMEHYGNKQLNWPLFTSDYSLLSFLSNYPKSIQLAPPSFSSQRSHFFLTKSL